MARSSTTFGPFNTASLTHGARSHRTVLANIRKANPKLRKELAGKDRSPLIRLAISVITRREMVDRWLDGAKGRASRSIDSYIRLAQLENNLLARLEIGKEEEPTSLAALLSGMAQR